MEPREHSDRPPDQRNGPLLTNTFYADDNVVQFLVTIRGSREPTGNPARTPLGHLRNAIIMAAFDHHIDVAVAGPAPMPPEHPFQTKRG